MLAFFSARTNSAAISAPDEKRLGWYFKENNYGVQQRINRKVVTYRRVIGVGQKLETHLVTLQCLKVCLYSGDFCKCINKQR